SVLVTSHLLGELERTCDHVVVIDGGKLLRSSSTRDFTQATASLAVEVTDTAAHPDGTAALRAHLAEAGLTVQPAGRSGDGGPASDHVLLVDVAGDETYDVVRDAIAGLGLGLIRMEQRRHRIAEIFRDDDAVHDDDAHDDAHKDAADDDAADDAPGDAHGHAPDDAPGGDKNATRRSRTSNGTGGAADAA
ncbi:ABC transporter ATP-binding protein, partial [Streptomyces sp. 2MCAF27]